MEFALGLRGSSAPFPAGRGRPAERRSGASVSDHISCNLRLAVRQEPVYGQQFLPHLQSARPGQCARWFPLACLLRETDEPPLQDIPVTSIKVAGYVDGQSVMPEGLLDALTDDQVTDLVRYAQSLK